MPIDYKMLKKPMIISDQYGPLLVVDLEKLTGSSGKVLDIYPVTALCRCGHSENKPYCDGHHAEVNFENSKDPERKPDKTKDYLGKDVTIIDNRGVCSHDGACVNNLREVFDAMKRPWIMPNNSSVKDVVDTVEKCPSGALSYRIGNHRYQNLERDPEIIVDYNGPLQIIGGIVLKDYQKSTPECGEHYCLCRCGESKNKPFCDGSHLRIKFFPNGETESDIELRKEIP